MNFERPKKHRALNLAILDIGASSKNFRRNNDMKLKNKFSSVLVFVMVLSLVMSLPVFAKAPKQPKPPIPQSSTIPEVQYIPEPQQDIVPDNGDEIVTPQWAGAVHYNTVREGISILKRDKPELAYRLTRKVPGMTISVETLLKDNVNWPDTWEKDLGTGWPMSGHFYDPSSGCNYAGYTSPTAYTRFNNHYYNAKNATNAEQAFRSLAYSLHYLGDLNAPHHAANVPYALTGDYSHSAFESFADSNYGYYQSNWTGAYFLANMNTKQIADYYATNAKSHIEDAKSGVDTRQRSAIEGTLPYAQGAVAGMIYRFLIETNY